MADVREHGRQHRVREQPRIGLPNRHADAERAVFNDVVETGNAVDVHEQRRAQQAHVQRRHEALSACEHLRLVVLGERRERVVETSAARSRTAPGFIAAAAPRRDPV